MRNHVCICTFHSFIVSHDTKYGIYYYKSNYAFHEKIKFGHGKIFKVPDNILLIGCYHPSPRNVNTGRINEKKMTNLFLKVLKLV